MHGDVTVHGIFWNDEKIRYTWMKDDWRIVVGKEIQVT